MNCEDYQQAISADPSESFDGGAVHVANCASCRSYRDEMRVLDDKIAAALAITVPALKVPELPAIEADSNVVNLPFAGRLRASAPAWIGIAASLAVALVLGVRFLAEPPVYGSLAAEVLAHLDHEPGALRKTNEVVSERKLAKVVRADIATMNQGIGLVTFARSCVINGKTIPHLVIQGENGPVTILLLPGEEIENAIPLNGEGVNGVILPVGKGSIAIVGDREENIGNIQQRVIDSVEWSI
jgi:hypothetical protein